MAAKRKSAAGKGRAGDTDPERDWTKRGERSIQWVNLPSEIVERLDAMMFWQSEALRRAGKPYPSNQDLYDGVINSYLSRNGRGADLPLLALTLDEPRRSLWLETKQLSKIREHAKRRKVPGFVFVRAVFIDYIEHNVPQAWADLRRKVGDLAVQLVEAAPVMPAGPVSVPRKPAAVKRD